MNYIIDFYLSIDSILQIALASLGLFFIWFWWSIWKGLQYSNTNSGVLHSNSLIMKPSYRQLFRLHRFFLVRSLSATLAFWSLILGCDVFSALIHGGYIPYNVGSWSELLALFAFVTIYLFFVMRRQGLAIRVDDHLVVSWDANDALSLHLSKKKINHLSYDLIINLISITHRFQAELDRLGINSRLNVESWLLAPPVARNAPAVKKLRKMLDVSFVMKLPSKPYVRPFRFLIVVLYLLAKSPLIHCQLKKIPKPVGQLSNGFYLNKYTESIESALISLKNDWRIEPLPLTRMSTFSVIALVIQNPRVHLSIGGWAGGVTLSN